MRRFSVLFMVLGFGLGGCVAETDTSSIDTTSDAVEIGSYWVGRDGLLYTGDRKAPIALGVDFSRIGATSQGLAVEREEDPKRPPPTPLRVTQPAAPPPPEDP